MKKGLYFNQAELNNLIALETAPSHAAIWNYLVANVDSMIGGEIGLGSYDVTEQWMQETALVWAMTGNTKYADQLKTWCLYLAGLSDWGIPEYGQEPFAAAASSVAFAYDVLYNYLTSAEQATISGKLIEQVNAFYNHYLPDYPLINMEYPNVSNMIAGAVGLAGLVLEGEYNGATAWISWAQGCAQHIITVDGDPDGGWFEGPGYAVETFRFLFAFFDALKRLKGTNMFTNNFLQNLTYFIIWCTYNDSFLGIEDTERSNYWRFRPTFTFYRLASEYNNGYTQWLANRGEYQALTSGGNPEAPVSFAYMWKSPNVTMKTPVDLPLTKYFSGIGYVFYRTGWTNNDYVLAFKSGTSRGHAHGDQNSLSLFGPGGSVISGNPGYLAYPVDNLTKNSNCILSNGLGQAQEPGTNESAPLGTRGIIQKVDFKPNYIYIRGDAHAPYLNQVVAGYPELSSGDLTKWLRHLIIIDNPFYFVVYDDTVAPQAEQIDWNFVGDGGTFTVNGQQITLSHGTPLNAVIMEPAAFTSVLVPNSRTDLGGNVLSEPMLRVHPTTNTSTAKFLTALFPGTALPVSEIKQANLLGLLVQVNAEYLDMIMFSADGQVVNQWVELGKDYIAADGGTYTFNGTQILVQFTGYQVIQLKTSSFPVGSQKTATFPVTVIPSGLLCQVELWLGPNANTKSATSGLVAFTSTGAAQNLSLPITMPTAGTYNVYINIYVGSTLIKEYIGTTPVVVV